MKPVTAHARDFSYLFAAKGARVPGYMRRKVPNPVLGDGAKCRLVDAVHFRSVAEADGARTFSSQQEQAVQDQAARKVCNGTPACPVRQRCLLWALQYGSTGVAGGVVVTPSMVSRYRQGRKLAARRRAERSATEAS
jgi:Transcription factor WhiB